MNGTILNLGPLEILVIIIMALLVLGPERLPGIMRGIGTGLRKLRETYVSFVSEFRNELQPIAEEVDTVTREIQGELAAIREAADIRSVLQPISQDLTDTTNLKAPPRSNVPAGVDAPAWGIGAAAGASAVDSPPQVIGESASAVIGQPVTGSVVPVVAEAAGVSRPMTVEEAILGPARAAEAEKKNAEEATAAAAVEKPQPRPKPFSIDEPQQVLDTQAASQQYHRTMLMAEFSRTRVELKNDNPWGAFEVLVRSDGLDEDSPWRA
jgi:sec-independent protein translocase protein TatB